MEPSPAVSCSRSEPQTTARCPSPARPIANDQPTSTGSSAPTADANRSACPRSASSEPADSTHGSTPLPEPVGSRSAASSGAPSNTTCTLVPLIPNADTAERRGRPVSGHGVGSVSREMAPESQSTCGVGSLTCRVRGRTPARMAITILMTPAIPAAACACPMFDLIEPSHNGRSASRS